MTKKKTKSKPAKVKATEPDPDDVENDDEDDDEGDDEEEEERSSAHVKMVFANESDRESVTGISHGVRQFTKHSDGTFHVDIDLEAHFKTQGMIRA